MKVKFYNCETEREDYLNLDNICIDFFEIDIKTGEEVEVVLFDVSYNGKIINQYGDIVSLLDYKKPSQIALDKSYLGEYVNTTTYGEKFVERTDNHLCIGSDGEFRLMELIGLSRKDYVPTHEIWDALDSWLSGQE